MFIPYSIWQEVYVFNKATIADLIKTRITSITVDISWVYVYVNQNDINHTNRISIEEVYPCSSIAKQELLEMSVGRISKALEN